MTARALAHRIATEGGSITLLPPVGPADDTARAKERRYQREFLETWKQEFGRPAYDCQTWVAHRRLLGFYENRIGKLERQLRAALASDAIDDELRAQIIGTVLGTKLRDANLLTAKEADLIAWYRAADNSGRQLLRTMLERIAATNGDAQ